MTKKSPVNVSNELKMKKKKAKRDMVILTAMSPWSKRGALSEYWGDN